VSQFREGFEAGQKTVGKKRATVLYAVVASMGVMIMVEELLAHRYFLATLAPVFCLLMIPWLCREWLKPDDNGH